MSNETVNVSLGGLQYAVPANRYETESQKYEIAWDIAKNKPKDSKTFNQLYSLARSKQSQKWLGCDYDRQTQKKILQTFKS